MQGWAPEDVRHHTATTLSVPGTASDADTAFDAIIVFGGIAGTCSGDSADTVHLGEAVTNAAWLYAPGLNREALIMVPRASAQPSGRYKHACAASAAQLGAIVCVGGLTASGDAVSDAWMLVVRSVDFDAGEAQGAWTRLSPTGSPGPRHSATLVSTPQRGASAQRGWVAEESFVLIGGSTAGVRSTLDPIGSGRSDVWLLSLSSAAACGADLSAAWLGLFPEAPGNMQPLLGAAVARTNAGEVVAFGGYEADAAVDPRTTRTAARPMVASVRVLERAECLDGTALSEACPAEQAAQLQCVSAAANASVEVRVRFGNQPPPTTLLQYLAVGVVDSAGVPMAEISSTSEALPQARRARRLAMQVQGLQAGADQRGVLVRLNGVLHDASAGDTDVVASAYGVQLGRRNVQLEQGQVASVELALAQATPLRVAVRRRGEQLQQPVDAELFLWHNGTRTAWDRLGAAAAHQPDDTFVWQVRAGNYTVLALTRLACREPANPDADTFHATLATQRTVD